MFKTLLAAFLLVVPGLVYAQSCGSRDLIAELEPDDRAALDALVAQHPYPEGNLFRATKDDSTVTVVGTLHLPDARHSVMVGDVRPAIENADLLILEASSEAQAEIQRMTATNPDLFFLTDGPTLIDLLSEDEWDRLKEILAPYGIPGFMAAKFKPWFLGMTLAVPPCAMQDIQQGEKGLDLLLENVARDNNVPIAELDDLDALMDLLAGDPLDKQIDGLRMMLSMKMENDAELTTMVERYFQGKAREVVEFSRLTLEEKNIPVELFDELMQGILEDRNIAWEPKIVELVDGKNAVLAVGAAHLSGETGVLRALERAGYTIERL